MCCGAECACCCFRCCAGCCGSGRGKGHKRMNSAPPPPVYPSFPPAQAAPINTHPINEQYRSHTTPTYRGVEAEERPQFARFDAPSKPVNEDALPHMPSWKDAKSTQVEEVVMPEKQGDMEMDRLDRNGSVTGSAVTSVAAAAAGRRTPARSPVQRSPTYDNYGFPPGYQNDSFVGGTPRRSPRNSPAPQAGQYGQQQDDYRMGSTSPSISPVYGAGMGRTQDQQFGQQQDNYRMGSPSQSPPPVYGAGAGYTQNQQYGRRSPNQGYNQQAELPAPSRSPAHQSPYNNGYGNSSSTGRYIDDNYIPNPARSHSPSYTNPSPSHETSRYELPAATYPGQQTYETPIAAYPGQQTYQAFQPSQQESGVTRKPVDGSWKEV
ncbi:hypothetical protein CC78DRAFT_273451 [Lojkania enalia]|uniref:Uncharacterized protein n=1 Tax=Lojkania enalia TaxID=147567 RepID=A0A9P4N5I2_9PLEO|nr:hypothetical protein CC78DRAFT_273451 [Didymosphaeria enalia]